MHRSAVRAKMANGASVLNRRYNKDTLQENVGADSGDLVCLDPSFNSKHDHNLVSKSQIGHNSEVHTLVTGGGGYIGSGLCPHLLAAGHHVICFDRFFFGEDTVRSNAENKRFKLVRGDIRGIDKTLFKGIDFVVHLAGLSNDPCSDLDVNWTTSINYEGAMECARQARAAGVKRFIFASSCSVYGYAKQMPVTEESACEPVSLYAQSKLATERELTKMAALDFVVTFMRNATVYGFSPRMRYDLIINSMTWHAFRNRKVYILGGGQQWRPLIHIQDICRAIICMLDAPADAINARAFNIGSTEQNYRVHEVAAKVKKILPGIELETVSGDTDIRSYNVSFARKYGVRGRNKAHG
jgi:nucleoside-diphosphate-sugar epimerase